MGGKYKLTDTVIDDVEYYFHVSMNKKVGTNAEEMRNEILSVLYYCTSTDQKPQHEKCAKSKDSWCSYSKSLARAYAKKCVTCKKMKVSFHLTDDQLKQVKAVYDRMTSDEMMQKL